MKEKGKRRHSTLIMYLHKWQRPHSIHSIPYGCSHQPTITTATVTLILRIRFRVSLIHILLMNSQESTKGGKLENTVSMSSMKKMITVVVCVWYGDGDSAESYVTIYTFSYVFSPVLSVSFKNSLISQQ